MLRHFDFRVEKRNFVYRVGKRHRRDISGKYWLADSHLEMWKCEELLDHAVRRDCARAKAEILLQLRIRSRAFASAAETKRPLIKKRGKVGKSIKKANWPPNQEKKCVGILMKKVKMSCHLLAFQFLKSKISVWIYLQVKVLLIELVMNFNKQWTYEQ